MNWYLEVLRKYAVFSGRARRKEYWMFFLFNIIIALVISVIECIIRTQGVIGILYSIALICPSIAVTVRRLHDTNRNGLWILISLIPIIGTIVLIVFLVQDSQAGENRFGPNPKDIPE